MGEQKKYRHVAIYLRKSRKDAEIEEGGAEDTLSRHRKALFSLAKSLNLPVEHVYEEVVSGDTIAARKQIQLLLAAVEEGRYDAILCYDIDRLGRGDMRDQGLLLETLKWNNCDIITPEKTWILKSSDNQMMNPDEELWEVKTWGARIEYRMIKKRLARGRLQSAQSGLFIGHIPPYGYTREKRQGQKGWILVIDEPKASVVRDIYRWFIGEAGEPRIGVSLIVRRLNDRKIPGPTGKDWVPCTVRSILSNPEYAGFIRSGNRREVKTMKDGEIVRTRPRAKNPDLYPGLHEPIITVEQSDRAMELLATNKSRPGPKQLETKNPLGGLVYCSFCNRAMVRRPYTNGTPDSLMCSYTTCKCVGSRLSIVEEMVIDGLREWVRDAEVDYSGSTDKAFREELSSLETAMEEARRTRQQLDSQIKRAYELVEKSVYSIDIFQTRMKELSAEIEKVDALILTLETEHKQMKASIEERVKQVPNVKTVLEAYEKTDDPRYKNILLKSVLTRIDYYKTQRERWGDGSDLKITLHPRYQREAVSFSETDQ